MNRIWYKRKKELIEGEVFIFLDMVNQLFPLVIFIHLSVLFFFLLSKNIQNFLTGLVVRPQPA